MDSKEWGRSLILDIPTHPGRKVRRVQMEHGTVDLILENISELPGQLVQQEEMQTHPSQEIESVGPKQTSGTCMPN